MPHADPEVRKAYHRAYRLANPERMRALDRSRRGNPAFIAAQMKYRFSITPDVYSQMLAAQGGVCAICQKECVTGKNLAVDHDHSCCPGKRSCGACIRGLLCSFCNTGIGFFSESPESLVRAIAYLERARV